MVSQEEIKINFQKIGELQSLLSQMEENHQTAMFTWRVGDTEKTLPSEDVDAIIEDYKQLKTKLQKKFRELL